MPLLQTYENPKNGDKIDTYLNNIQAFDILSKLPDNKKNDFIRSLLSKYPSFSQAQRFYFFKCAEQFNNGSIIPLVALTGAPPTPLFSAPIREKLKMGKGFDRVYELFMNAKASGLKKPKITLSTPIGAKVELSLAGNASANPGFIYFKFREAYFGKISPQGEFSPSGNCNDEGLNYLKEFAENPLEVAQAYGKRTGNCCCCNRLLTDPQSVADGVGPVCRARYGL